MDLLELGTALREERERQELSVKDVADQIKISRHCLEAIEGGRQEELPHPVYAKGFIKNYGRLLGFDQDELNEILSEIFVMETEPIREVSRIDASEASTRIRAGGGSSSNTTLFVAIVLFLVIIAGGVWFLFSRQASQKDLVNMSFLSDIFSSKTASTEPPANSETSSTETSTEQMSQTATPTPIPQQNVMQESSASQSINTPQTLSTDDVANEPPTSMSSKSLTDAGQQAEGTDANAAEKAMALEDGKKWVEVFANQPCWLEAGTDSTNLKEIFLKKGQRFVAKFEGNYIMRVGNAGGVSVTLNGEPYPLTAARGEVKTLHFQ
ncbi:helix-turn-helix domain-containing protein [Desulfovibrio inopinatus]|uniref:helix-turn-helix domain-containing protein n=1 Tax=Desulfovibrio inopinatus TaxID=102109 RepID=UPI0003F54B11|nr:helix-turn-helix domain-containing protein [Desulfovibrio inopinatus]